MVMGFGKARLLLTVCPVLALAACASAVGHPAGTGHATPGRATPSCGPGPAWHAWAVELTTAGRMTWQTQLPSRW